MYLHHVEHAASALWSMMAAQAPAITSLFPENRKEIGEEKSTRLYLRTCGEVVYITTLTPIGQNLTK